MVQRCPSLETSRILMQEIVEDGACASTSCYSLHSRDSRSQCSIHHVPCLACSSHFAWFHTCFCVQNNPQKGKYRERDSMRRRIDCGTNIYTAPSIDARLNITPSSYSGNSVLLRPTCLVPCWQKKSSL